MKQLRGIALASLLAFLVCASPASAQNGAMINASLKSRALEGIKKGTEFLISSQKADGSFGNNPGFTGLATYALLLDPRYDGKGASSRAAQKALDYIVTMVKPDGGIYDKGFGTYVTAVCLLALTESGDKKYRKIIADARNYLIAAQCDEAESIGPDNMYYGGFGYGAGQGDGRPDLSNTQLALSAIKAAEDYETRFGAIAPDAATMERDEKEMGLHWKKALAFIDRCQNNKDVNKQPYADNDGGFIYETGHYKLSRSHSYGSMTYAGALSLLYSNVGAKDPRVKKAEGWIKNNYTVDFNPGFGTDSIYYYYVTFARALNAIGGDTLTDAMGQVHNWREDLLNKLMILQKADGSWQNPSNRYMENSKDLATSYALIAAKFAMNPQNGAI